MSSAQTNRGRMLKRLGVIILWPQVWLGDSRIPSIFPYAQEDQGLEGMCI